MPLANSAPALTRPDGSPLRVLVVDDEVNIAELITWPLRYEGWEVPRRAHRQQGGQPPPRTSGPTRSCST